MKSHRRTNYRKHWKNLVRQYGNLCYYCRKEIATQIDHIIPYSYYPNNDFDNLVPSCAVCNLIANDKTFDSIDQKQGYILEHRKQEKYTTCINCLLPYVYLENSPSLFLCAYCYDLEYSTNHKQGKQWEYWLKLLEQAHIFPLAHFRTLGSLGRYKKYNHSTWVKRLLAEYDNLFQQIEK